TAAGAQSAMLRHLGKRGGFRLEETEFFRAGAMMRAGFADGCAWIFGKSSERGVGEAQPGIIRHLQARDDAEALRVALEAGEVGGLGVVHFLAEGRGGGSVQ